MDEGEDSKMMQMDSQMEGEMLEHDGSMEDSPDMQGMDEYGDEDDNDESRSPEMDYGHNEVRHQK